MSTPSFEGARRIDHTAATAAMITKGLLAIDAADPNRITEGIAHIAIRDDPTYSDLAWDNSGRASLRTAEGCVPLQPGMLLTIDSFLPDGALSRTDTTYVDAGGRIRAIRYRQTGTDPLTGAPTYHPIIPKEVAARLAGISDAAQAIANTLYGGTKVAADPFVKVIPGTWRAVRPPSTYKRDHPDMAFTEDDMRDLHAMLRTEDDIANVLISEAAASAPRTTTGGMTTADAATGPYRSRHAAAESPASSDPIAEGVYGRTADIKAAEARRADVDGPREATTEALWEQIMCGTPSMEPSPMESSGRVVAVGRAIVPNYCKAPGAPESQASPHADHSQTTAPKPVAEGAQVGIHRHRRVTTMRERIGSVRKQLDRVANAIGGAVVGMINIRAGQTSTAGKHRPATVAAEQRRQQQAPQERVPAASGAR